MVTKPDLKKLLILDYLCRATASYNQRWSKVLSLKFSNKQAIEGELSSYIIRGLFWVCGSFVLSRAWKERAGEKLQSSYFKSKSSGKRLLVRVTW